MLLIPDDIILEREDQVAESSVQRVVIEVLLWWGGGGEAREKSGSGNPEANSVLTEVPHQTADAAVTTALAPPLTSREKNGREATYPNGAGEPGVEECLLAP